MRIISGKYKGKVLDGYNIEGTRPTMDRVKESLFAMIQNDIKGSTCLDLFAGTGSLGIESLSNGAKQVYMVDNGSNILPILKKNLKGIEDYKLLEMDYMKALSYFKDNNIRFDLILLDPPYHKHYVNNILKYIVKNNLLTKYGKIVVEYEDEEIENDNLNLINDKHYGDKKVKIFQSFDN